MHKTETAVAGAWIIDRDVHRDDRGTLTESFGVFTSRLGLSTPRYRS